VLVLDDDQLVIRAVTRTLRLAGLEVEGTVDAAEALALARRDAPHVVVSDLHMPASCGAVFLATIADVAPDAMRVLMTADPDLRPRIGSLADARLHALMTKAELGKLAGVLIEQLRGRLEQPSDGEAREVLATQVAHVLGRPHHEDDAHRERLARRTTSVGAAMGLSAEELSQARLAAILHDVGQIALRELIFTRPRSLSSVDVDELSSHPDAGARIVDEMPSLRDAAPIIRAHHERTDGNGYPSKVGGESIPRAARALQVADAYDAMTTGRPYSPARSHRDAIRELKAGAGRQHDPEAVRALESLGEATLSAATG
jgi:response regulator RpfG family c-di-GMP phosphodiesterase